VPGETNQNNKTKKLTIDKIVATFIIIIDILVIFVKKKKNVDKSGNNSHHPDLPISCNLLTLTLIPGIRVIKKVTNEIVVEFFSKNI